MNFAALHFAVLLAISSFPKGPAELNAWRRLRRRVEPKGTHPSVRAFPSLAWWTPCGAATPNCALATHWGLYQSITSSESFRDLHTWMTPSYMTYITRYTLCLLPASHPRGDGAERCRCASPEYRDRIQCTASGRVRKITFYSGLSRESRPNAIINLIVFVCVCV